MTHKDKSFEMWSLTVIASVVTIAVASLFMPNSSADEKEWPSIETKPLDFSMDECLKIYEFKVTRVIDGDTFEGDVYLGLDVVLKKQVVRIKGYDAPETRTRDTDEKARGILAKKQLQILIENKTVLVLIDGKGSFKRLLGNLVCPVYKPDYHKKDKKTE